MKAAVLEGDADCSSLVAFSIYDTKLVHFLLMAYLNQVAKNGKIGLQQDEQPKSENEILRSDLIDDYNNGMNKVDQADQLHGSYWFDHWICKCKWWWAIWLWECKSLS